MIEGTQTIILNAWHVHSHVEHVSIMASFALMGLNCDFQYFAGFVELLCMRNIIIDKGFSFFTPLTMILIGGSFFVHEQETRNILEVSCDQT
jgi:hypothetical protein